MESQEGKKVNTLGDAASLAVEKYYQKILRHEVAVMDDRDPEELHPIGVGRNDAFTFRLYESL
jgi:CHAD domain-containing protein